MFPEIVLAAPFRDTSSTRNATSSFIVLQERPKDKQMQKEQQKESRLKEDTGKVGKCVRVKTISSTENEILLILLETKAKHSSKENAVSFFTKG